MVCVVKKTPDLIDAQIEEMEASAELKRSVADKGVDINLNSKEDK